MCTDVFSGFIGCFSSSSLRPGAPDTSTSPSTGSMSQLKAALLSPLSSMLGDLVHRGVGSSGGFGGVGDVLGVCSSSCKVH